MFLHFSKPPQNPITQNSIRTVPWLSQSGSQSVGQSVSQSLLFEFPGSIPGESNSDLWCMKGHWDKFSLST